VHDPYFNEKVDLYHDQAIKREKLVSNVSYELLVSLLKDPLRDIKNTRGKAFYGHIKIKFDLDSSYDLSKNEELFVDYNGLAVKDLILNGVYMDATNYFHHHRIGFDSKVLKPGKSNTLTVVFKSKYRTDGEGVHLFKDPEDDAEYIYTKFEPFFANRAFPVFDQPDIKATLKLRVIAPASWTIIGNGKESGIHGQSEGYTDRILASTDMSLVSGNVEPYKLFEFNTTKRISSYLFAFLAGNYQYFEQTHKVKGVEEPIRMRLYFRKSVESDAARIQDLMFGPVSKAMEWYSDYFGYPYAFDKFDQIFVPEFSSGAMENVGAVTFSESYMARGRAITESTKISIINTALHELAHMWFGNLVTMRWWDDLWLNEAFATFISYYAMSEIKSISEIVPSLWVSVSSRKQGGYVYDELSTSHPVYSTVRHVGEANDNFDGITYGKGCAFLQQLLYIIGDDSFSLANKLYFKNHAWKNTNFDDFIHSLVEADKSSPTQSTIDIESWAKKFLNTKGVNTLEIFKDRKRGLGIKQSLGEFSNSKLRQKLNIMVIDEYMNTETIPTVISDKTVITIANIRNLNITGKYYIANAEDKAYTKIYLDEITSRFLSKNLSKIDGEVNRAVVWRALSGMVKHLKLTSTLFFEFVHNNLKGEKNPVILNNVLGAAMVTLRLYIPDELYIQTSAKMFGLIYDMLLETTDQELVFILKEAIVNFASSKSQNNIFPSLKYLYLYGFKSYSCTTTQNYPKMARGWINP